MLVRTALLSSIAAKQRLEELAHNFDVRKMAARMEDQKEDYYILCGWMADDDVARCSWKKSRIRRQGFCCRGGRPDSTYFGEPPAKLQNPEAVQAF